MAVAIHLCSGNRDTCIFWAICRRAAAIRAFWVCSGRWSYPAPRSGHWAKDAGLGPDFVLRRSTRRPSEPVWAPGCRTCLSLRAAPLSTRRAQQRPARAARPPGTLRDGGKQVVGSARDLKGAHNQAYCDDLAKASWCMTVLRETARSEGPPRPRKCATFIGFPFSAFVARRGLRCHRP